MIISHTYRYIFLKSHKTAGTSVEAALSQQCRGEDVVPPLCDYRFNRDEDGNWLHRGMNGGDFVQHEDVAGIKAKVAPEVWDGYFKFSITRNPWDRALSLFFWERRREVEAAKKKGLLRFLGRTNDDFEQTREVFREWLQGPWSNNDRFYFLDGKLCVDFVIRYERLAEDYEEVCRRVGITAAERLPRLKSGIRRESRHYSEYYDDPEVQLVADRHALDIEHFGYRFERGGRG